jgi:polyhydroxyalkanoate synthesis repressor PhaR
MQQDSHPTANLTVELRRYPNRRYYDCTRSQHLTLEDIYRLVQEGFSVKVSDSKTGEDITARVLAQLILDHDPPKLAAFPAELLHQIIRSNESLLRDFVEKYFNQALSAFLKSQQDFDQYLGQAMGLYGMPSLGQDWAEIMMGPFARAFLPPSRESRNDSPPSNGQSPELGSLRQTVDDLRREIADLRKNLEQNRSQ